METHLFDIHDKPVLFIQCICFIIGLDLSKMGFDPSVSYEDSGKKQCITVSQVEVLMSTQSGGDAGEEKLDAERLGPEKVDTEKVDTETLDEEKLDAVTPSDTEKLKAEALGEATEVTYEVTKLAVLSHTRSIRGTGAVVRDAKEPGVNGAKVLIIDRWVHDEREKEVDIYRRAVAKGVKGLVPIQAVQEIDDKISTAALRHVEDKYFHQNDGKLFPNLVLARLVLEGSCTSITDFESRVELLEVYRDAVQGKVWLFDLTTTACLRKSSSTSRSIEEVSDPAPGHPVDLGDDEQGEDDPWKE